MRINSASSAWALGEDTKYRNGIRSCVGISNTMGPRQGQILSFPVRPIIENYPIAYWKRVEIGECRSGVKKWDKTSNRG